jgi:transcriptional regulator with XRE-family HTH domain
MNGEELKLRRKALGMTQAQLAEAVDLSRDFIGQMERGIAPIGVRTAAAVRALRAASDDRPTATARDPMERLIEDALLDAGVSFTREGQPGHQHALDFYLPDSDVFIEVKRFHSDRIAAQTARVPNVIVAQGKPAVEALAALIRAGGFAVGRQL